MPKQLIMRILGAAIVLIALSFAPSVAQAHTSHGHQHQASVHGGHRISCVRKVGRVCIIAAGSVEASRDAPGFGPQLHRRLLLVRMRRLLRGRPAQPCDVRRVSPVDNARCVCAVTDVAAPRARVAQAASQRLHLNPTEQ